MANPNPPNPNPPIVVTEKEREEVEKMAEIGLRTNEIAAIKGLGTTTIENYFQEEMSRGRQKGKQMLFKTAYKMAVEDENPTILIFLLKTRCGLREKERMSVTIERKKKPKKIDKLPVDVNAAAQTYTEVMKG